MGGRRLGGRLDRARRPSDGRSVLSDPDFDGAVIAEADRIGGDAEPTHAFGFAAGEIE